MDLVTGPGDIVVLLRTTLLGLLNPDAQDSLAPKVDFIILLESFHSIPNSVPFSESSVVCLTNSLSGLAHILSPNCFLFQIWFGFYLGAIFIPTFGFSGFNYMVQPTLPFEHLSFLFLDFSVCFGNFDFSWPLRHLLLFHHFPKMMV